MSAAQFVLWWTFNWEVVYLPDLEQACILCNARGEEICLDKTIVSVI